MARLAPFVVPLVVLLAALAGCTQKGASTPQADRASSTSDVSAPPSWAPRATATPETGSVTGLVIDPESVRVADAQAKINILNVTARTDPSGRFTLNDLAPGNYSVTIEAIGFYGAEKKIDIAAGQVTSIIVTLRPIPVDESFTETHPLVYLIHVDHDYVNFGLRAGGINQSAVNSLRCDPCSYVMHIERHPVEVYSEAIWNEGPGPVNTQAYLDYYKKFDSTTDGTRVAFVTLVNQANYNWTAAEVTLGQNETALKVYINGGFTTISYEQKVQTWTSFSYNGRFPENFTALPPP